MGLGTRDRFCVVLFLCSVSIANRVLQFYFFSFDYSIEKLFGNKQLTRLFTVTMPSVELKYCLFIGSRIEILKHVTCRGSLMLRRYLPFAFNLVD